MYSVIVDGKVLDVSYRRLPNEMQSVYVGDIYVGQVMKMRRGWSAVSGKSHPLMPVHGFRSREQAMELLLKVAGFHRS